MSHIHSIWKIKITHRTFRIIMISKVHFNSLFLFFYGGLIQFYQMFRCTTSTWLMSFYTTPITLIFMVYWWFSTKAHYFVQPLKVKILVHNILWTHVLNFATTKAHLKHDICVFYHMVFNYGLILKSQINCTHLHL